MKKLLAITNPPSGNDFDDPAWAAARTRLALYLRALELPEAEAASLLDAALAKAQAEYPAVPLVAAMAALHALLAERDLRVPGAELSLPPMHRAPMVPEHLDRSPVSFLFAELFAPFARGARRLFQAPYRQRLLVALAMIGGGVLLRAMH